MLPDVHDGWLLRFGAGGIEIQSFATASTSCAAPRRWGRGGRVRRRRHRLRHADPPGQVGKRQSSPAPDGPANHRPLHRAWISDCPYQPVR
jgi:hypothetical protein